MKKFFLIVLMAFSFFMAKGLVTINDYTTWGIPGGTTTFNPTGDLIVNDTLIIFGNLDLDLDEDLVINSAGVLIVFGDFDAKNKVDLGLGGYFIVTGDFNKNGGQGEVTDNGGSMYIFDDTPTWGSPPAPPEVDYGDEEDIVDDDIFDFFDDLVDTVCAIAISNVTITDASCTGNSDGAINITVTGVNNPPPDYLWSNGASTEDISGIVAGNYSVNIYEGFCFAVGNYTVNANPLPDAAGAISGLASVCMGSGDTYTVPAIANATSYVWSANNGAVGTSITNSINLVFPNSGTSTITVHGINSCGNGTASTRDVTINITPGASILSGNTTTCAGAVGDVFSVTNNAAWTYLWTIQDNTGTIQAPGNTSTIAVDWKSNSELFTGPYLNDTNMTRKVTTTINTNPANGCPKVLEWDVTIYRQPETGPAYYIPNDYAD